MFSVEFAWSTICIGNLGVCVSVCVCLCAFLSVNIDAVVMFLQSRAWRLAAACIFSSARVLTPAAPVKFPKRTTTRT